MNALILIRIQLAVRRLPRIVVGVDRAAHHGDTELRFARIEAVLRVRHHAQPVVSAGVHSLARQVGPPLTRYLASVAVTAYDSEGDLVGDPGSAHVDGEPKT